MRDLSAARRGMLLVAAGYAALVLAVFSRSSEARFRLGCGLALEALFCLPLVARYARGGLQRIASPRNAGLAVLLALSLYEPFYRLMGPRKLLYLLLALLVPLLMLLVHSVRGLIAELAGTESAAFLRPEEPRRDPRVTALLTGLGAALLLTAFWLLFFYPYGNTADSENQWMQVHGQIPYSDIHSIGHTLFLGLLLKLSDSFVTVVAVQIVLAALVWGLFAHDFARRSVHGAFLAVLLAGFLTPAAAIDAWCYPLKDAPYTVCVALLTWLLMRYLDRDHRLTVREGIALGVLLALIYEFRKNGVVLLLFVGLYFLVELLRRKAWKPLVSAALALALVLGGVYAYAYGELKTESPPNGWGVQVFGTGLVAMAEDGTATPEELAQIRELVPLDWALEEYRPWDLRGMLWHSDHDPRIEEDPSLAVFNNGFVLAMCEHKGEIVRLYFSLLPRHLAACVRNVLYSTQSIWGAQGSDHLPFSNVFLLAWLWLLVRELWDRRMRRTLWPVFLPVLLNVVSIAISTVTNELRYLLPTTLLCPILTVYILCKARESRG